MMFLLRLLGAAALGYAIHLAWENARAHPHAGDLMNALYLAICAVLGIFNAILWAPVLGDRLSRALTSSVTESTSIEKNNRFLRLIGWLDQRRFRRLVVFLSFLEGIRHPTLPAAFMIGLHNARPGSWLEKVFAREVFRFDNIQHCLKAFTVLKRHGVDPRPHRNPEVNLALVSLERSAQPAAPRIRVPAFGRLEFPSRESPAPGSETALRQEEGPLHPPAGAASGNASADPERKALTSARAGLGPRFWRWLKGE